MAKDRSLFVEAERALWSRSGITPAEHRVKLPAGNEVRVQEVGEGPPVVFIHGAAVAGSSWALLANALAPDALLLWGDEDPNGGRPEAEAFAARLPNATLEMLDRAGHAPWIDEIDVCAAKTRSFLLS